jgi:peptidyl-prolyl cis-trans isomerase D
MLSALRNSLNLWPVKLFFLLLAAVFVLWGVNDVFTNSNSDGSVATVAGRKIDQADFQIAFQRQLQQIGQMMGNKPPPPEMRTAIAQQTLQRLVTQTAITAAAEKMGIAAPDDAVRQAVFDVPAFHGPSGQFDRATMQSVLANNGMTEPMFLRLVREDLVDQQLLESVRAGISAPVGLAREVFAAEHEKRRADLVELPFSAVPPPPAPDDAAIERWWDNHPDLYSSPEFRRIKAVVLSAETIAKSVEVSDAEMQAWYEAHKANFETPEKRSVQAVVAQDQAEAVKLAVQWKADPTGWAAVQAAASAAGASATELDESTLIEFPSPELGRAVFDAPPDAITGPVSTPLGWAVLRVTHVTGGTSAGGFDAVKAQVHDAVAQEKATDLLYDRANKVQDLLAGGAKLEELPDDLGLNAVSGTLDAQGNTPAGEPAPIPGGVEVRAALVGAAFSQSKSDPARLIEAPDHSYYAVEVDDITAPERKPLAEVKSQVIADLTHDEVRHTQEEAAAALLHAVRGGPGTPAVSLADAALKAGLRVSQTPEISRDDQQAPPGFPLPLARPIFGMKVGEATMVETPEGFDVAVLASAVSPDPAADPAGFDKTRLSLTQALGNDFEQVYASVLRSRGDPRINQTALEAVVQP